jgi:hypothetical protein
MPRLPILLVGSFESAEFAAIASALDAICASQHAATVHEGLRLLKTAGRSPAAMVLAWPCPGSYCELDLAALRKGAPLARQFAVLGSWCEGEPRGGEPVAGVIRTVWHQWLPTWLEEFRGGTRTLRVWELPETAGGEERLLARATQLRVARSGLVAIVSRRRETAELLSRACQNRGYATVWLREAQEMPRIGNPQWILWDGDAQRLDELELLGCWTRMPIVALLDFPRAEDVARATAAGAAAVLGRPLIWEALDWHLDRTGEPLAPSHNERAGSSPAPPYSVRCG